MTADTDLTMILIAELHRAGLLKGDALSNMARRLEESDLPDLAARVVALPLSNMFDTPASRRATIHAIDDETVGRR